MTVCAVLNVRMYMMPSLTTTCRAYKACSLPGRLERLSLVTVDILYIVRVTNSQPDQRISAPVEDAKTDQLKIKE